MDKKTHRFYSQNEHGPKKSGPIGEVMEVEVKEALRTLTDGDTKMNANEVMSLRDRLFLVDEKFSLLRREITRLNAVLAEQKDKNDALQARLGILVEENNKLKSQAKPKATKKVVKKKTTKKK